MTECINCKNFKRLERIIKAKDDLIDSQFRGIQEMQEQIDELKSKIWRELFE